MADHKIAPEHMQQLKAAKHALENVGVAVQIANVIGTPIEKAIERLPKSWQENIVGISRDALQKAADVAIWTINPATPLPTKDLLHFQQSCKTSDRVLDKYSA